MFKLVFEWINLIFVDITTVVNYVIYCVQCVQFGKFVLFASYFDKKNQNWTKQRNAIIENIITVLYCTTIWHYKFLANISDVTLYVCYIGQWNEFSLFMKIALQQDNLQSHLWIIRLNPKNLDTFLEKLAADDCTYYIYVTYYHITQSDSHDWTDFYLQYNTGKVGRSVRVNVTGNVKWECNGINVPWREKSYYVTLRVHVNKWACAHSVVTGVIIRTPAKTKNILKNITQISSKYTPVEHRYEKLSK